MFASLVFDSDYPIQNHFRTRDIPLSQPMIKILSTLLSIEGKYILPGIVEGQHLVLIRRNVTSDYALNSCSRPPLLIEISVYRT